jgi:hypothetical protein
LSDCIYEFYFILFKRKRQTIFLQHRKRKKKQAPMGPPATAEEAIIRLLQERKISNKINYEVLNDLKCTGLNRSPVKETSSSFATCSSGEPVLNR